MRAEPLSIRCPDCRAPKNQPCVYLWPKDGYSGQPRVRSLTNSPSVINQMDRAGTPMKKLHNGRYAKAQRKMWLEKRKAENARRAATPGDLDAILRANGQAIHDEHNQLLAWLRENARILTQ